jgi:hypothetical protein
MVIERDAAGSTVCCGVTMSTGSVILAGGALGKRTALPHSRILSSISRPVAPRASREACAALALRSRRRPWTTA